MSDVNILNEMIKDTAKVKVSVDNYGKNKVTLREAKGSAHAEYAVTIFGIPDEAVVIKADAFEPPKSVFNDSKGECKRADFVIVADMGKEKVIICIEMKAGAGKNQEIIQQLKGAHCFMAYCQKIGQSFWNEPNFLHDYAYRFVSIRNISIPKKQTRFNKKTELHDCPDKMLKVSSQSRFQFNHLVW